jgi:hypothetical protein
MGDVLLSDVIEGIEGKVCPSVYAFSGRYASAQGCTFDGSSLIDQVAVHPVAELRDPAAAARIASLAELLA